MKTGKTPFKRIVASLLVTSLWALAHSAAAVTLDQSTCEATYSGAWTAGAQDLCVVTDLQVNAGDALTVGASVTLHVAGLSTIHGADVIAGLPAARLDIDAGARLEIVGDLTNEGIVEIDGDCQVDGSFSNVRNASRFGNVELAGSLTNHGSVSNSGYWFVLQSGVLESDTQLQNQDYGIFSNLGTVSVLAGELTNRHQLVNSGGAAVLTIEQSAELDNTTAGATVTNAGGARIGIRGTLTNSLGAGIINDSGFLASTGAIQNHTDAYINNLNGGLIANLGVSGIIQSWGGGTIRNHATIHNIALIENYCSASFFNSATGVVSNVMFVGTFDNFGGLISNSGVFFQPAVMHACQFNP